MTSTSILNRPVYGVLEAAGLLGLRGDRARAWLDGYERRGAQYPPVIRVEPTGEDVRSGQQILLADDAQRFFKKVEFDPPGEGDVRLLRPAGVASPVVIDPLVRFGRPSVQGVATERLWELFDAGEQIEQIADGYDMPTEEIRAAIAYEEQLRSLAA